MRIFLIPLLALAVVTLLSQATAEVAIRSGLSDTHRVQSGAAATGSIIVENVGPEVATVRIYQTDYSFQADGTTTYSEPSTLVRSNANWIVLGQSLLKIEPGLRAEVDYTLTVPPGDYSGTYWSVIMIEEIAEPTDSEGALAVTTVLRYGVQVIAEVPGPSLSLLEFGNPGLVEGDDSSSFQVDISNVGERMLEPEFVLELYDQGGSLLLRTTEESTRTYPGTSIRRRFDLGNLEPGRYNALVVADTGSSELFGAQYQLVIDEQR